MPEGYCRNGVHYVGDSDECPKCDIWEQRQAESHAFYAARKAHVLKESLP